MKFQRISWDAAASLLKKALKWLELIKVFESFLMENIELLKP